MSTRILSINPMGTDMYDEHMESILLPMAAPDTELVVRSLQGVPKTPFLPTANVFHNQLLQAVVDGEQEGFDGVIICCAGDPALKEAKTLVSIPVTAPFEAAARTAPSLGRLSVISPSEPEPGAGSDAWRRARDYGVIDYLVSVRLAPHDRPSDEESDRLFRDDPEALSRLVLRGMEQGVQTTAMQQAKRAVDEDGATVLFFACTLWGGMLGPIAREVQAIVLDPVLTPLKYIEQLAAACKYYRSGS